LKKEVIEDDDQEEKYENSRDKGTIQTYHIRSCSLEGEG
jgi:hypothetical protein